MYLRVAGCSMCFAVILSHLCYNKKMYQALKRQVSSGQYRKAVGMFNSRKVKIVIVIKEGGDIFVNGNILQCVH